jgi:hypothetical protein
MTSQSPFLSSESFEMRENLESLESQETISPPFSPFLSLYESEGEGMPISPENEEFLEFLNELQDEEMNEALFELAAEATELHENQVMQEEEGFGSSGAEAERVLEQHFDPLAREVENMLEAMEKQYGNRDPATLSESELETFVDNYQPESQMGPAFENFFKRIGRFIKRVGRGAINLAKKGIKFVGSRVLGPILNKIKALIRPLLRRVIRFAIGKLPANLQPIARKLAEKFPFLREFEEAEEGGESEALESESLESESLESENAVASDISEIQQEFNYQVASILFAPGTLEQELEVAEVLSEYQAPSDNTLAELDKARVQFEEALANLKEGEDPRPHLENFIPAILPALRLGIKLIGRQRVVDFLAKFLAKLIQRFIGPQWAPALSKAMVDIGLRMMTLEATPEMEAQVARSAVTATVEETIRQVAALPEYVLENEELLEAYTLEAFENAVAANMPPILSEEIYRKRPDLRESIVIRGAWVLMPLRRRKKRYKKFTKVFKTRITPYKLARVKTFGGERLSEFLEEQYGLQPGQEVEAEVHLYEGIGNTQIPQIAQLEQETPGLGSAEAYEQFHPLTPEAAEALLGDVNLGRYVESRNLVAPYRTRSGQRHYYLRIPGRHMLTIPGPGRRPRIRKRTRVKLVLDFPNNRIRIFHYLSEIRAQAIAAKLREQSHTGIITSTVSKAIDRGVRSALAGGFGRLKIIHEAVVPEQWIPALRRLPSVVPQVLRRRIIGWSIKGLAAFFKQEGKQFIAAAENPAEGVTLVITIVNPPGFGHIRQALRGRPPALSNLKLTGGTPTLDIKAFPGIVNE